MTLIRGLGLLYLVRGAVDCHGGRVIAVGNRARPGLRVSGAGLAFAYVAKCVVAGTSGDPMRDETVASL